MRRSRSAATLLAGISAAGFVVIFGAGQSAQAAAVFTPGDVIVMRTGNVDGSAIPAAQNSANVWIDQYSAGGTLVQSIAMPSGANGFTIDKAATSDGVLQFSGDGRYLMFAGYSNAAGNAESTLAFSSGANKRMGARIDNDPVVGSNVPQIFQLGANAGQVRSLTAIDGTNSYVAKSDGGPRTVVNGATSGAGTILSRVFNTATATTVDLATRQSTVVNGDLYTSWTSAASTASPPTTGTYPGPGIYKFSGLPTSTGGPAPTQLVAGSAYNSYFFLDLDATVPGVDTLYAVDVNPGVGGQDIEKYSLVGGTWVANGSIASGGANHIAGYPTASGGVTFFASTFGKLAIATDTGGYNAAINASLSDFTTSAANYSFRGVAVVVPEPTSLALLGGIGVFGLLARRRTR